MRPKESRPALLLRQLRSLIPGLIPSLSRRIKPDLSSLGSMLQARWKGVAAHDDAKPEAARAGQIRKFRIAKLDPATKKIELELA